MIPRWLKEKVGYRLYAGDVRKLASQNRLADVNMSLLRLKQRGVYPKRIYDIGSYYGEFLGECVKLWPEAEITAFEALPDKVEFLKKHFSADKVKVVECIIGNENKDDVTFYTDENASSTLFSEEVVSKKGVINQPMIRLDTYVESNDELPPELLQIDTLSSEYEILNGFGKYLNEIGVVILQVNFIEVFHGVRLAHDVIEYLASFDFEVYDVCDVHRRPLDMALWQMDLLFVKRDSPLRSGKQWDGATPTILKEFGSSRLSMVSWLKDQVRSRILGGEVKRLIAKHKFPDLEMSLMRLKAGGVHPSLIFDFMPPGADTGVVFEKYWPGSQVVLLEAAGDKIRRAGTGSQDGHTASEESGAVSFDNYIRESGGQVPGFVRLDDRSVCLLSAESVYLQKIDLIMLPLHLIESTPDIKLASEMIPMLAKSGFLMYDVCSIERRPSDHAVWQMIAIFVKEDSRLRQNKKWG